MHLILCIWLPFYRPCSFASQTFIWFANFLIIALILCKKLILLYFNAQLYTRKIYRFNARKTKKNSRYIYPNCSSTSEVHAALTLLFPAHLYSDRSISLELLSVFLSDSLNYLLEKNCDNVTPNAVHIFSSVISDGRFSCAMILPSDDWKIPDSCDNLYLLISRFSHKDVILSAIYVSICK